MCGSQTHRSGEGSELSEGHRERGEVEDALGRDVVEDRERAVDGVGWAAAHDVEGGFRVGVGEPRLAAPRRRPPGARTRRLRGARCGRARPSGRRAAARRCGRGASRGGAGRRSRRTPSATRSTSIRAGVGELDDVERVGQQVERRRSGRRGPSGRRARRTSRPTRSSRSRSPPRAYCGSVVVSFVDVRLRRTRPSPRPRAAASRCRSSQRLARSTSLRDSRYISVCTSTSIEVSSASMSRHSASWPKIARAASCARTMSGPDRAGLLADAERERRARSVHEPVHERGRDDLAAQRVRAAAGRGSAHAAGWGSSAPARP